MDTKDLVIILGFTLIFFGSIFAGVAYQTYLQTECVKEFVDSEKTAVEIRSICFGVK